MKRNASSRIERHMGSCCSSSREESGWMLVGIHCEVESDALLARLKARLVAKRYSQIYEIDYQDTFSSVAKMIFVRILVSLATAHSWPLH